jgi:hypothetical protein
MTVTVRPIRRWTKAETTPLSLPGPATHNCPMEALLKVRKIGDGVGLILPEELLAHLGVQIGDSLEVETTTHGILLRALRKP